MKKTVKTYMIPKGSVPGTPPRPDVEFDVEGGNADELRRSAHEHLSKLGHRIRAISFTPTGLVAYVEECP